MRAGFWVAGATRSLFFVLVYTLGWSAPGLAHNFLLETEAYAGYRENVSLLVTHGCKGSPVKEVRLKIPEGVMSARPHHNHDWTIETVMKKLDEPITVEGGRVISEIVDQIIWKDPKEAMPDNMFEEFSVRMMLPNKPGEILYFQSVNICEDGERDAYVDLPEEPLKIDDAEFGKKTWAFMTATATPAPFLILRAAPKKQYPWEWTPEQVRGEMSAAP